MKTLDAVIYEMKFQEPSEQTLKDALNYLRDYKDLLLFLRVIDHNWKYIQNNYLKDGENEVQS